MLSDCKCRCPDSVEELAEHTDGDSFDFGVWERDSWIAKTEQAVERFHEELDQKICCDKYSKSNIVSRI